MKRSLTTLCLLLCLASAVAVQGTRAHANANGNSNTNGNVNGGGNVNANANANANSTSPVPLVIQPGQPVRVEIIPPPEQPKGLNPLLKDWVDVISKIGTPISIGIALILALMQFNKNRDERDKDREQRRLNRDQREADVKQRKDELRWRKSQLARELLKGLYDDPYAADMMTMLDWDEREFCVKSSRSQKGKFKTISWADLWAALRISELEFNEKEKFIRDCADAFFGRMQILEHYLTIGLIEIEDVVHPFDYYLDTDPISDNPVFKRFIKKYHPRAEQFVDRLNRHKAEKKAEEEKKAKAEKVVVSPPAEELPSQPAAGESVSQPAVEVSSPSGDEVSSPTAEEAAYFMFDCPPGEDRLCVRLEAPAVVSKARENLSDGYEWCLTGEIVEGPVYYNAPWDFHIEPASVGFVEYDPDFALRVNERVEASAGSEKAVFRERHVWHTKGARLLTELPVWWFTRERDVRWHNGLEVMRARGRVVGAAPSGVKSPAQN